MSPNHKLAIWTKWMRYITGCVIFVSNDSWLVGDWCATYVRTPTVWWSSAMEFQFFDVILFGTDASYITQISIWSVHQQRFDQLVVSFGFVHTVNIPFFGVIVVLDEQRQKHIPEKSDRTERTTLLGFCNPTHKQYVFYVFPKYFRKLSEMETIKAIKNFV